MFILTRYKLLEDQLEQFHNDIQRQIRERVANRHCKIAHDEALKCLLKLNEYCNQNIVCTDCVFYHKDSEYQCVFYELEELSSTIGRFTMHE